MTTVFTGLVLTGRAKNSEGLLNRPISNMEPYQKKIISNVFIFN